MRTNRIPTLAAAALTAGAVVLAAGALEPPATEVAFEKRTLTDAFYAEGAAAADFNRDSHVDVAAGPFWYEGPKFESKHEIYEPGEYDPKEYSQNFLTFAHDINRDDWPDVIVFGFPGAEVWWFENPGSEGGADRWTKHLALKVADNESPAFADLTGDGVPEIICSQGGRLGYASADPDAREWTFVPTSEEQATGGRFTHGLGVGDVNGDGRLDVLDKDNWWEQPESLGDNPLWKRHRFQFSGPGGSQMYAYDFDGDGDNDILTSLAAHAYGLAWFEQVEKDDGSRHFEKHLIVGEKPEENPYGVAFSQMHAIELADMDGDGIKDIVTGKRWWAHGGNDPGGNDPAVLYWFRTVPGEESGKAEFLPYFIDDNSGVGTQFSVVDISGDMKPDIVVSNKKGTTLHIQK